MVEKRVKNLGEALPPGPPRHLLQPLRGQQRGRGLLRARTHARRRGQVPPEAAAAGLYLYRVQQRPR